MTKPLNRRCAYCGETYTHKSIVKECSLKCRLMNRIKIVGDCWEWQDFLCKRSGYGRIRYDRKFMTAHRLSYIHHKGEIPKDMCVLHKCDNKLCVNPEHLFLGTNKENTRDMMEKGRMGCFKGKGNSQAVLVENDILEIKKLIAQGFKQREISEIFKVGQYQISRIKNGKRWKHV